MNTATLKKHLEIQFGKVFGLLHNSLALVGVAALLVLMLQGGRYASPEQLGGRATAFGTIRYAAISLFEPAEPDNLK